MQGKASDIKLWKEDYRVRKGAHNFHKFMMANVDEYTPEFNDWGDFEYHGAQQKIRLRHIECGNEFGITINNFMKGHGCNAKECVKRKKQNAVRKKESGRQVDKVSKIFEDNPEYDWLDRDTFVYDNVYQEIRVRHTLCGTEFKIPIAHWTNSGSRCPNSACIADRKREPRIFENFMKAVSRIEANGLSPLFTDDEYAGVIGTTYPVKCATCGEEYDVSLEYGRSMQCRSCYPSSSAAEQEIVEYLRSIDPSIQVLCNDRLTIGPKELDINIPEHKLAIEHNGLFWHSEEKVGTKYHREKSAACNDIGMKLFHVYQDEWKHRKEIVKSMLAYRVGQISKSIPARKLTARTLSPKEAREFFEANHLSGHVLASAYHGLVDGDEDVICAISLRFPFHKKNRDAVEIARFATKTFTTCPGGFSKLLKCAIKFARIVKRSKLITYADLNIGDGKTYSSNGFTYIHDTPLSYWYTDGNRRYNRFKYRAQNGMTEREYASACGVWRIYGAGSSLFEMELT